MPRRRPIDTGALDELLRLRERVVTHTELLAVGVPMATITSRIRPGGPWQRIHPGVVLAHSGSPTRRERLLAAVAYARDGSLLTGLSALRLRGVRAAADDRSIHVLVTHDRRRQSRDDVRVERVRSMPDRQRRQGMDVASVARCTVDACRNLARMDDVRELIAEVVQTSLCTPEELLEELKRAARQRTALPRLVLREVAAGVRSAAEAKVRAVFTKHGIQQPSWNCGLYTLDGEHVVTPDGYWELIGCAIQIDSMAWHLSPGLYQRTQRLERAMSIYDVPFLPVAPADVFRDEVRFVAQVKAFLARYARHEPSPDLIPRPVPQPHRHTC